MSIPHALGRRVPRELVEGRWQAVSEALADVGYEALIVVGRGLIGLYGNVFYLSGLLPFNDVGHSYVFLRRGESAQLVVGKRDQVVAETYGVEDLVWHAPVVDMPALGTGVSPLAAQLAQLVDVHGLQQDAIGIVGLSRLMPVADLEALRALQPGVSFEDADALLAPIKAVKSEAELALYRDAVEIADAGFEVLVESMAAGVTEAELGGRVEHAVRAEGCVATIIQVLRGHMYTRPPTVQTIAGNEMIHGYVEVVAPNGYWVEKGTMFALGSVAARWLEVYGTLERAYAAGERLLRAGTTAAEVARAVREEAEDGGCASGIWAGHGVGIDHDIPVLSEDDHTELQPGMVISLHPHLHDSDFGVFSIDQYTITNGAPVRHSKYERQLHTVAQ